MPRKNKHKVQPPVHGLTVFDANFKPDCYGCAFAGADSVCLSSDGKCLKIKPEANGTDDTANDADIG